MNLVFFDTNVLLYCFDDRVRAKRDAARQWVAAGWSERRGRISHQVLGEFYSNARRKFSSAISAGDARAEVRRFQHWQPWVTDHATIETAWAVESRFGLNYWDALIIAAAQQLGCRFLLSEDMQHEQHIDGVQIINPFLVGPGLLDTPA